MKRLLCLLLSLLFVLPLLVSCKDENADKLVLSDNGESLYRIVKAANATEVIDAAAGELQNYFYAITGVTLPIVTDVTEAQECEIIIGKTNRPEGEKEIDRAYLGAEGFCIRNLADTIIISGKEDRGTLYGVYSFIEEYLGVRYWGEHEESIPRTDRVILDRFEKDNIQKPGFSFRLQSHQTASSYNEKLHLNAAWSGDTQPIAGGIEYTGPWYVHTFGSLLGWNSSKSYRNQPCLSDPAIFEKMFNAACKYIEQKPEATVISISQNDSTLTESGECKCDACVKEQEQYGSSGAMLRFINRMANALKSKFPHIYVETLAYYYTQEPPKGGVTAAENVIVRFCNAGGCMMHALSEEAADTDQFYPKNTLTSYENLKGWSEAADTLYIWDYNIDFGCALTSIPNFDRLYNNIKIYRELGVDGIYMQGMRDAGEFDRLRGYLAAKLLWNPRMSREEYDAHIADFLNGYYAESGVYVKQYLDYITELCKDLHPAMYHDTSRFYPMILKEDGKADTTHLDIMKNFYNDALAASESYTIDLRVRRTLLPILYYETLLCAMESAANGEGPDRLITLNQALLKEMRTTGLTLIKEGLSIPKTPNFRNTILYWGWDGTLLYNDKTAAAHEEAKKNQANEDGSENEGEEGDENGTETPPDVTDAYDEAEKTN